MSALNKLAHLSLVNKVTTELENHIGIADKTLSEFIIDLAGKHTDPRAFQKALEDAGAELSFDLVRSLLGIIQRMKPGGSKGGGTGGGSVGGGSGAPPKPRRPTADDPLPGLAVRDDAERAKALTREIYGDNPITANMADDPRYFDRGGREDDRGRGGGGAVGARPRPALPAGARPSRGDAPRRAHHSFRGRRQG